MTTEYLKRASKTPESETESARKIVSDIIAEIERRGETAVRDYAHKLDNWSGNILMSHEGIDRRTRGVSTKAKRDIDYATEQVRRFALAQRDSVRDFSVELAPGLVAG